ncbi:MAG: methyltransferase [Patescibacteria group bacterium]|nr:methyltransferase [Patescibacteria group bacterium]
MTNDLPIRLILSDIRSAQNVGAILRTADACRVELVYACGYTPYPIVKADTRPAHIAASNTRAIAKTALGAERTVPVLHFPDTASAISEARSEGFNISIIEQAEDSLNLYHYQPTGPTALVLGNEVTGVAAAELAQADTILELPMLGAKESLNVSVAAGIALYQLRFGASRR